MKPARCLSALIVLTAFLTNDPLTGTPAQNSVARASGGTEFQILALETHMHRSFNYCQRMVDAGGQPYFNVFWTEPAEAAHDWPDFGDVPARQYQGIVMGRRMTGISSPIEMVWRENILFRQGGHMHGNLRTLVGSADYALYTRDPVMFSRVDAIYRWVRSQATRFGFLPESIGRPGDIVGTETCALDFWMGLEHPIP